LVSSSFRWFVFVLIIFNFSITNANFFVEFDSPIANDTIENYDVKLLLIDKSFENEISELWGGYKFGKLGLIEIKDFSKNISGIYEKNGYFPPKIYYHKLGNKIYLIISGGGKEYYKTNFTNDKKIENVEFDNQSKLEDYFKEYLKKIRDNGYLFPFIRVDSVSVIDSIIQLNLTLNRGINYPIKKLIISPKKYDNSQIISFFTEDSVLTNSSIKSGVDLVNSTKKIECSDPIFSYDSLNKFLVAKIKIKSKKNDYLDMSFGADTSSITGYLRGRMNNILGRINFLSINLLKYGKSDEEFGLNYSFLLSQKRLFSINFGINGIRQDSSVGYVGGEISASVNIVNSVKLTVPMNYSYHYNPKESKIIKSGLRINIDRLNNEKETIGHKYTFSWLMGINSSNVSKFSRDVKASLIGGLDFYNINFIGKMNYLGYSYNEDYLIPLTAINGNIFRGSLPYTALVTNLYSINLDYKKYFFSNFGSYIFNDFLYYKGMLNDYHKKFGVGVGFEILKSPTKIKISLGTDVLSENKPIILGVGLVLGI